MKMSRRVLVASFAAGILVAGAAFIQHERDNQVAYTAKPLFALPATRLNEHEVRDRDIAFYAKRLEGDPESATDRYSLAGLLYSRSRNTGSATDLDRAEDLIRESIDERTQRNYQAFDLLASVLMTRHEFQKARDVALRVNALDPGMSAHLALLGEIELELGMYDEARAHFDSVNYDERNFTIGARIARWHELTGSIDHARGLLQRAIVNVDKRDDLARDQVAWFHYRLGDLELRAGNFSAADSAFRDGLRANPDDYRVLGGLARLELLRHQYRQAIQYGERATVTQFDPATLGTVSLAYAAIGDSAQAASYAHAMSVSALKQPGAIHRAWGLFLLDHGTAQDKKDVLVRARQELQTRKDVYGHDLMAWALYRNGRLPEARSEMRLALAQHTQDVALAEHARAIGVAY